MSWETVIGLEVHSQLKTRTKLFCGCAATFGDPPNTNVCPVCLGLPGALPVPNEGAVRLAIRAALALECTVHDVSVFARKNYFYPDLPKGYQISQFEHPLATGGVLDIGTPEQPREITIARLHLEEDAGKSLHDRFPGLTAVDFNRCGVPLIEIVTQPDLRDVEEVRHYLVALKQLLEYLEVSDCNMEEGSLRVDANLSVRRRGQPLGTKQEVKNMNSFAAVVRAIADLRDQQIQSLEQGGRVERMTYSAATGRLRPVRVKEESHDYRYFPEPDLPVLDLARFGLDPREEATQLPELPRAKRARLQEVYQLSEQNAGVLTGTRELADYYEAVAASIADVRTAAHWVMGAVLADANEHEGALRVAPHRLAELIALERDGTVSNQAAKKVFQALAERDEDPHAAATRLGLLQVGDVDRLSEWVEGALATHPEEVARYKHGERKLLGFFMGQVMRKSSGQADPRRVRELLLERLVK